MSFTYNYTYNYAGESGDQLGPLGIGSVSRGGMSRPFDADSMINPLHNGGKEGKEEREVQEQTQSQSQRNRQGQGTGIGPGTGYGQGQGKELSTISSMRAKGFQSSGLSAPDRLNLNDPAKIRAQETQMRIIGSLLRMSNISLGMSMQVSLCL